jgi:dTDP-D-glucose 4,6-dehydratase
MVALVPKACLQKLRLMILIRLIPSKLVQIFVRAYGETYGLPYVLTNCSNNYGPFIFLKLSLFINNIIQNKPLPVYGDGKYTRDWLFVEDHAVAIDLVFIKGQIMIRIIWRF